MTAKEFTDGVQTKLRKAPSHFHTNAHIPVPLPRSRSSACIAQQDTTSLSCRTVRSPVGHFPGLLSRTEHLVLHDGHHKWPPQPLIPHIQLFPPIYLHEPSPHPCMELLCSVPYLDTFFPRKSHDTHCILLARTLPDALLRSTVLAVTPRSLLSGP